MELYDLVSYSRPSRLLVCPSDPGRILRVHGILSPQGYGYTVTTRYQLKYPRVTILKSYLLRNTGPKVGFFMLPFIMFGSTPFSGHGHIFEPCKQYRALRACT